MSSTGAGQVEEASVVVVGAGISGLVTARELVAAGIDDVVVLEAQDHVAGRVDQLGVTAGGFPLIKGGEFTCPAQKNLLALAAELGVEEERPLPVFADPTRMGMFVRISKGVRYVEPFPLANDPDALRIYTDARATMDELARAVPADLPWDAPDAAVLDAITIGQWIEQNVANEDAREYLAWELCSFIDQHESSMLYLLWFLSRFGGWDEYFQDMGRFVGGSVEIPRRIALQLGSRVRLSTPVRRIDRADDSVFVHSDRGAIRAGAVVLAMDPSQCGTIAIAPPLPERRRRLEDRWQGTHGTKIFAVYDTPWWRAEGLCGLAFGPGPVAQTLDVSPADGEGILFLAIVDNGATLAAFPELVNDDSAIREAALDALEAYFGPKARAVSELRFAGWSGHEWSGGCTSSLPPGALSTVGQTLREPIGRVVFAGAETGTMDFMEGAVTAGQRAARESARLLGA